MEHSGFSPSASAELASEGGPWQRRRRVEALERFAAFEQPTTTLEDWRYSRIDELDLGLYAPVRPGDARTAARHGHHEPAALLLEQLGPALATVRSVDGVVVAIDQPRESQQLRLTTSAELGEPPPGLGELVAHHDDVFVALSDAFSGDIVVLDVPAGARLEEPIVILHEQLLTETADGRRPASFPRTVVRLGEQAEASVIEVLVSGPGRRLVVPVTEIDLAAGARLSIHTLQELGRDCWHLGYQASRLAKDAHFTSFVAALGGDYARQLTRSSLEGAGSEGRLLAVYLGDGEQMQDLRTFQEHVAPHTRSQLVFKGAVGDKARSVYTGLIGMRHGARRADASQTNRNLVLSEGAHADSVPNLDIEENDVRCSHASAVGPIDPELVFYLESRGVPPAAARRLVLLGFFEDLLGEVPSRASAEHVRRAVTERLLAMEVTA